MKKTILTCLVLVGLLIGQAFASTDIPVLNYTGMLKKVGSERGKVVLVNFWATWCTPCRMELPHLKELRKAFPDDDVVILGVSVDQDSQILASFLNKSPLNYQVFQGADDLLSGYRVRAVPHTLIYNKNGEKVFARDGLMEADELRNAIQTLLNE